MVFFQQLQIHPGLAVKALDIPGGNQLNKVLVALLVFAEQNQVVGLVVHLEHLVEPGPGGHIDLAADNGLYPLFFAGLIKIHHAVHAAVVGNGAGLLTGFLDPLGKLGNPACPV